jgi:hypothetical protein
MRRNFDNSKSPNKYRAETALLKDQARAEAEYVERLKAQSERLGILEAATSQRVLTCKATLSNVSTQVDALCQQVAVVSKQENTARDNVVRACSALVHAGPGMSAKRSESQHLCASPEALTRINKKESLYTEQVTRFAKTVFHNSFMSQAASEDSTQYRLISVHAAEAEIVHGRSKEQYERDCKEMARLQNLENMSEQQLCEANIDSYGSAAAVAALMQSLSSIKQQQFTQDQIDPLRWCKCLCA